jgi:hypothetical protein
MGEVINLGMLRVLFHIPLPCIQRVVTECVAFLNQLNDKYDGARMSDVTHPLP